MSHIALEWKPMDSAPTDGTQILCYNPVMGVYSTSYTRGWRKSDGSIDMDYRGFPCGQCMGMLGRWDCHPFCWAEMPSPPTSDELFVMRGYDRFDDFNEDAEHGELSATQ